MSNTKHIVVIRLSAMGDVAMTVPVLRALTVQYPQIKVTVVSREMFRPFFDDVPSVKFFAADVKGKHKGFLGLLRLYSELRELNIDAVADLHNVLRSKVVTAIFKLTGTKKAMVDKARAEKKALTRAKNKIFKQLMPVTKRYAEVFKALGFELDLSTPVFPEPKQLTDEVLAVTGNKNKKWIGIAPFAQHQGKVYPQDLMQQVIEALASDNQCKIFLFGGGKEETEILEQFAGNKENVTVVAGKLKMKQELSLISHLDVMLSMDSGNAHMAAMLGKPVVTLWGATHPYAGFAPFNQPEENMLLADREKYPLLPTSIYGNKVVEGYEDVMRTIPPETVVKKINEILKKG